MVTFISIGKVVSFALLLVISTACFYSCDDVTCDGPNHSRMGHIEDIDSARAVIVYKRFSDGLPGWFAMACGITTVGGNWCTGRKIGDTMNVYLQWCEGRDAPLSDNRIDEPIGLTPATWPSLECQNMWSLMMMLGTMGILVWLPVLYCVYRVRRREAEHVQLVDIQ